jgi:hypothetical protein
MAFWEGFATFMALLIVGPLALAALAEIATPKKAKSRRIY